MKNSMSIARVVLHLEGLVLFLVCLYLYYLTQASWALFILLFFIPDFAVLGYVKRDKKIGAIIYNSVHNYVLSVFLMVIGLYTTYQIFYPLGIILTAHISLDRFMGFGLRYTDVFRITHIQKT